MLAKDVTTRFTFNFVVDCRAGPMSVNIVNLLRFESCIGQSHIHAADRTTTLGMNIGNSIRVGS